MALTPADGCTYNVRMRDSDKVSPVGGTFTLTIGGKITRPISFDATVEAIQEAIDELESR